MPVNIFVAAVSSLVASITGSRVATLGGLLTDQSGTVSQIHAGCMFLAAFASLCVLLLFVGLFAPHRLMVTVDEEVDDES